MPRNRRQAVATLLFVVLTVAMALTVACSASSPVASPSSSTSPSPKTSASAPSSASPSSSASTKAPSAEEQAYQKAQDNWKKVVEAAQKEGEATFYTILDQTRTKPYTDAFNKLDPKIQVKFVMQPGAAAIQRFQGEASTKQYIGNAHLTGATTTRQMARLELTQTVDDLPALYEPGVKWAIPPLYDKPKETITFALVKYLLVYNTNLVPAGQEPKTWKDLADPKWKDKLFIWDPRIAGYGRQLMATIYLHPQYGPDVASKIVDNMRPVAQTNDGVQAVAKGEAAVSIAPWGAYVPVRDAPVKPISPEDGSVFAPMQVAVVKNAPQLNVTKVFLNWLLSKEGQAVVGNDYAVLRSDVSGAAKETQVLPGEKFMPNTPYTYDFEVNKIDETGKIIDKWINDANK